MFKLHDAPDVVTLLRHHAQLRPEQPALTLVRDLDRDDANHLNYQQLDDEVQRLAAWLQSKFAAGERVLLLYPVGLDFVVAFLACAYAGMIAVPAPLPGQYQHERRRLSCIATDAELAVVLTDAESYARVAEWMCDNGLNATPLYASENLCAEKPWQSPKIQREDVLLLQYTSGSTGNPKGVMITHHCLLHNVDSYRQALGFDEQTRFGGWIPLYHDMGLMAQLLPALFLGSYCVLMTPQAFVTRPFSWLRLISHYRINYSAAPDFAYELCRRRITDEQLLRLDLSCWRFATNGSEPVQANTLQAFAEHFAAAGFERESLSPCYGMAEATVYVSGRRGPRWLDVDAEALAAGQIRIAQPGMDARRLVSCGEAVGYDVCVINPHTHKPAAIGQPGEIWLRGESISPGYWRKPEASASTFQAQIAGGGSGFLRSGDLGLMHNGEIYICGRLKEMLVVHGRNLYPQDIEFELRTQHPELASRFGAVFAVDTEVGEVMVVSHEIRGLFSSEALAELALAIRACVLREFGVRPAAVLLLKSGSVRRTTSGKIQRTAMRELFLSNTLSALHELIDPDLLALRALSASTDTAQVALS